MPRKKKSRKVGLIGVRKDPDHKPSEHRTERVRKPKKGKPAGNRHNVESSSKGTGKSSTQHADPRHGSKKPVPLIKEEKASKAPVTQAQKPKKISPAEELAALEADEKLATLLDKLDAGQSLKRDEQAYVNEKVARHGELCEILGIDLDDDSDDDDPLDAYDAINIDDYKQ